MSTLGVAHAAELTAVEELGRRLFFDASLSSPAGQSCASCHDPAVGWSGPDAELNAGGAVHPGAIPSRFGNRKPPTAAYLGETPVLHRCAGCAAPGGAVGGGMGGGGMGGGGMGGGGMGGGGMGDGGMGGGGMGGPMDGFEGGAFFDGRATGWTLGDPLAEQAMGPFLNPLEQNAPNARYVCLQVARSEYASLFAEVWGALDCARDPAAAYERISHSIAAYERSPAVSAFSSRFDRFWDGARAAGLNVAGINDRNVSRFRNRGLSEQELRGLVVFNTTGRCSMCHTLLPAPERPLFTDFRYHNLGIPRNPLNPFYAMQRPWNPEGFSWTDPGLGGFLATTGGAVGLDGSSRDYRDDAAANLGKHRTPTLRNAYKRPYPEFVKAYGHNGFFTSLEDIIEFYDSRDVRPACEDGVASDVACWPPPEVAENVDRMHLGRLQLGAADQEALVAFVKTLDDE